jgi:integrase/recombinase XerC
MRRHTFATTLIRGGTGLVTVAGMPGHAASTPSAPTPHPTAADLTKALTLLPQDR